MGQKKRGKRETETLRAIEARLGRWADRNFKSEVSAAVARFEEVVKSLSLSPADLPGQMRALEAAERGYRRAFGDFVGLVSANPDQSLAAVEEEVLDIAARKEDLESSSHRLRRFLRYASAHGPARSSLSSRSYARLLAADGSLMPSRVLRRVRPVLEEINRLEHRYSRALDLERKYVFFRSAAALEGLPPSLVRAARQIAADMGKSGWALPLEDTVEQELGWMLRRPRSRLRLQRASISRGAKVARLAGKIAAARKRAARAAGKSSWAAMRAPFHASATPREAWRMLRELAQASAGGCKFPSPHPPRSLLLPSYDTQEVLERGCFYAAYRFLGLRIRLVPAVRMYHPSVRLYRVARPDGRCLGFIASDLMRRPGKEGGAWTSCWEETASRSMLPVVGIFCNLEGRCSFSGVEDIFHEFGHALHALLSSPKPVFSTALGMPNDLVEVPSLLVESWALDPRVYARIGSPASPSRRELRAHMSGPVKHAERLGDILSAAADLVWHGSSVPPRPSAVRRVAIRRLGLGQSPKALPSYSEKLFPHIFCTGYDASFFSYLWCERKAKLIAEWMAPGGKVKPARASRFARLLSAGASLSGGDFCKPLGVE